MFWINGQNRCWAAGGMGERYPPVINPGTWSPHLLVLSINMVLEKHGKKKSKNQPENRQFFHENRQFIKVYWQATEAPYALHCHQMEWNVAI